MQCILCCRRRRLYCFIELILKKKKKKKSFLMGVGMYTMNWTVALLREKGVAYCQTEQEEEEEERAE